jgi:hypothetical protein
MASRLVTMPGRRKHTRQDERCVGTAWNAYARSGDLRNIEAGASIDDIME